MADRVQHLQVEGAAIHAPMAPASPLELSLDAKVAALAAAHLGTSNKDEVKAKYDIVSLGELRFVAHKLKTASEAVVATEGLSELSGMSAALTPQARSIVPWKAGLLFAELLREHPEKVSGKRVVEVGSGVGVVGIAAGEAGAAAVTLTAANDLSLSLLFTNKELNSAWMRGGAAGAMHAHQMVWDNKEDVDAVVTGYGPFDVVLGSDVVVSEAAAAQLAAVLPKLLPAGAGGATAAAADQPTKAYIAHEVRHTAGGADVALRTFLSAVTEAGWFWSAKRINKTEQVLNLANAQPISAAGAGNVKPTLQAQPHVESLTIAPPERVARDAPDADNSQWMSHICSQPEGEVLLLAITPAPQAHM